MAGARNVCWGPEVSKGTNGVACVIEPLGTDGPQLVLMEEDTSCGHTQRSERRQTLGIVRTIESSVMGEAPGPPSVKNLKPFIGEGCGGEEK